MGDYLTKGTTYVDGNTLNAANLNAHVDDAVFKSTCISARDLKPTVDATDEFLINDAGTLKRVTIAQLQPAGSIVQSIWAEYTANTPLTVIIPQDDTLPQIGEGTEVITATITPRFATSKIALSFQGWGSLSIVGSIGVALFRDAVPDAIVASSVNVAAIDNRVPLSLFRMGAPGAGTFTYRIRIGPSAAGTVRLNGTSAARLFAGIGAATLMLQEIKQ